MTNMIHPEEQYLNLLRDVLSRGDERIDRTGVGTKAIFGAQMRFDLAQGFPIFTTKKVFYRLAWNEMLWMLSGSTKLRDLLRHNVKIWTDWPLKKYRDATGDNISQDDFERRIMEDDQFEAAWGDCGSIYGKQWRKWKASDGREIDQIQQVIDMLRNNQTSRRILFDGWNVGELDQMALPPCHKHYQFFVRDGKLDGAVIMRSSDLCLGLPFNICNLALLTHLLADQVGLIPGEIVWFGLDAHLYLNHIDAAKKQLEREPRPFPKFIIKRRAPSLFDYTIEDFELVGYNPHPPIKADVAV